VKLHADVAHPINAACRECLQEAVIVAYKEELGRSEEPDYTPQPISEEDDSGTSGYQELVADLRESAAGRGRRSRDTAPVASKVREDSRQEASHSTNEPMTSAPDADDAACPAPESSESKAEDDAFGDGIL
jgi:stage V sporulation protein G